MIQLLQYLVYTILLETPVVIFFYRRQWKVVIIVSILLNCFTWPVLSLLYFMFPHSLLPLELAVWLTEAVAFKIFFDGRWSKALLASFTANATSLLVGLWVAGISIF